jgi:hypothetical protein
MTTTQATATRNAHDARGIAARLDAMLAEADAEFDAEDAAAVVTAPAPVRCLGCRRILKSETSIARGRGKACYRRALAAAATLGPEYSDRQVESAIEAIEDGAVVPAAVPGVWYVVGSRGDAIYETTTATCTCLAFSEHGRTCWHRASVELVAV